MPDGPEPISAYRSRHLPDQLERARRRYAALVTEAHRYGLHSILTGEERERTTSLLRRRT